MLELLDILAIITATAVDLKTPTHGTNAMMRSFLKLVTPRQRLEDRHIYYFIKNA